MATCVTLATSYRPTLAIEHNFGTAERCYNEVSGKETCLFYIPDRLGSTASLQKSMTPKQVELGVDFQLHALPYHAEKTQTLTSSTCCALMLLALLAVKQSKHQFQRVWIQRPHERAFVWHQ